MKTILRTAAVIFVLSLGTSVRGYAQDGCLTGSTDCVAAPEINPALIGSNVAMLGCLFFMVRGRRKS
jgi:hypothetical protein